MPNQPAHLSDPILRNMGLVIARWAVLEVHMEFFILNVQEINLRTGLLLTTNLTFRAKVDLVRTFMREGEFPDDESEILKRLLNDAGQLYGKRNMVAHQLWSPTDNPLVANIRGVRTRGKHLITDKEISADEVQAIADEIHALGAALLEFMERNDILSENSPQ